MFVFAFFFIAVLSLCNYGLTAFYFRGIKHRLPIWAIRIVRIAISLILGTVSYFVRLIALGIMHLLVLLGLCVLLKKAAKRFIKQRPSEKPLKVLKAVYRSGIIPFIIIIVTFTVGFFNINNVVKTEYTVKSDKLSRDYRIVFISDTHFATVQNESLLEETVIEINKLKPDLVILGGDIVEEGTSKQKMCEAFATLGEIESRYGIYFIYGNHDRQRYSSSPSYTEGELIDMISVNNIEILKEEFVEINGELLLLGREDLGAKQDRLSPEKLYRQTDKEKFLLVADHQANDTDSNQKLGADLQLSGHTHGGQIFPLGWMPFFYNGYVYGEYAEKDMTVIVSSGFSGWGFPIRTQGVSEYVVVNLKAE